MQATRFWVMTHCVLLLGSGAFLCCGKDEGPSGHAGSAGSAGGGTDEPVGGAASSTPTGGSSSGGSSSGNGGTGATHAGNGGVSDALGGADAGAPPLGTGGAAALPVEQLTLCDRLTQRSTHAFNVARSYDHAVYDDCRTRWVTDLYLAAKARDAFLNDLQVWNLAFWGCSDVPVQSFALIYGSAPLSAGDAAALIEKYMTVTQTELLLSPAEADEMQTALGLLSQQEIADPSSELTGSLCDTGSGGAGGASTATAENGGAP